MKNIVKYICVFSVVIGSVIACTDDFEKYNSDKTGFAEDLKGIDYNKLGLPLNVIQQGIYFNYDWGGGKNWPYQIMQNLSADMYSGYMHDFNPFNGGTNNSDYNMMDGWNETFWVNTYAYIMPEVKKSEDLSRDTYKGFYAMTKILKVELMHRVSDYYGPIIYSKFGNKTGSEPDNQKDVYYNFFSDLQEAISLMDAEYKANSKVFQPSKFDMLTTQKNYPEWIKFANSLRLRLAVRIAMADPQKAQEEAKKSFSCEYGFLSGPDDIISVSTDNGYSNPVGEINKSWSEVYMNANMESVLNGYKDPRMSKFFDPATDDRCNGEYRGIRQGTKFDHKGYIAMSKIYVSQNTRPILMTAAEVWFLRAEAALRGWSTEAVSECYKKGVETSFAQWGVSGVSDYLQSENTGRDYKDIIDSGNDITARVKVSPKWDETATNEVKLEKIITQKWLSVFPEGCEAWAEQRRTGYPRLFPVRFNSNNNIDTETMIRRINFPVSILNSNPTQYSQLKSALGKDDNCGARLWWDTGKNF